MKKVLSLVAMTLMIVGLTGCMDDPDGSQQKILALLLLSSCKLCYLKNGLTLKGVLLQCEVPRKYPRSTPQKTPICPESPFVTQIILR
jgi:hypothetical protein